MMEDKPVFIIPILLILVACFVATRIMIYNKHKATERRKEFFNPKEK